MALGLLVVLVIVAPSAWPRAAQPAAVGRRARGLTSNMQRQISAWLKWTVANSIGVACGWGLSQFLSPWDGILAWLAFEVSIWFSRTIALRHMRELSGWQWLDTCVWLSGELVGAAVGEGFHQFGGSAWASIGQILALTAGASVWTTLWVIRQSRGVSHEAFPITILRGIWGLGIASLVGGVTFTLALELGRGTGETSSWISRTISGALVGGVVGSMTGWVFIRFRRWQISSSHPKD